MKNSTNKFNKYGIATNKYAKLRVTFTTEGDGPFTFAPRTFKQELREVAPAFGIALLFAGALVVSCCAFAGIVTGCAAIINAITS